LESFQRSVAGLEMEVIGNEKQEKRSMKMEKRVIE
jgi:hypothetical protein